MPAEVAATCPTNWRREILDMKSVSKCLDSDSEMIHRVIAYIGANGGSDAPQALRFGSGRSRRCDARRPGTARAPPLRRQDDERLARLQEGGVSRARLRRAGRLDHAPADHE